MIKNCFSCKEYVPIDEFTHLQQKYDELVQQNKQLKLASMRLSNDKNVLVSREKRLSATLSTMIDQNDDLYQKYEKLIKEYAHMYCKD